MINNYKNIKNSINNKKIGPIFFITPSPNRAIGLEKEIKDYHIICSQNTDLIDYLEKEKMSVLCIDDDNNIKNSGKLLENKKVLSYIKRKSKNKIANIITFKPSPKIQKICDDNNFRYIGNDWKLNRKFEDKIEFVNITNELKIPNAKSKIIKIESSEKFQGLFDLKEKYVIQLPRGFSGNSTFLIKNKTDLNKITKKYKGRKVKVSEYLKGDTYTINACVGNFGIAISQSILQITGLTDYNKNELGTSGNDYEFSKNLRSDEKRKIFNYTKKIGEYMKKSGYRGIFGLDFIVDNSVGVEAELPMGSSASGIINLIEINPRLIASIPVFTKLQIQSGQTPFLFLHLAEFMNNETKSVLRYDSAVLRGLWSQQCMNFKEWNEVNNFNFSQLILRNTNENCIKVVKSMTSGIYKIKKDKLFLKKKTYYADNLKENELLIQCSENNSIINSDMEYANIQVGYGIMEDGKKIKIYSSKIIDSVLEGIKTSI